MKKSIFILISIVLASCSSQNAKEGDSDMKIVRDTVTIFETQTLTQVKKEVDTVYISQSDSANTEDVTCYIQERLPDWFLKTNILDGLKLKDHYLFDNRMNPLYLEDDFNGDGIKDIAIPIKHIESNKIGFAIVHGKEQTIHIIGAGTKVKNGLSDDMYYIDIWKVNRKRINEKGLEEHTGTGENGELILENPSLQIEASNIGGGQIYWNGSEYAYFHQTC